MKELKSKSKEAFVQEVKEGNLDLARLIVNSILNNLNLKNKNLVIAQVDFEEEDESFELSCHSDTFIVTLEKNLKVLVDAEAYEECSKVVEAIKYLKELK
jgi:hypothetical protein